MVQDPTPIFLLILSIFYFLGCSSDLLDVVLRQTVAAGSTEDPMKIVLCRRKRGPNVPLACDIGNGCEKFARIALNLNVLAEIVSAKDPLVVVHLPERFRAASVSYAPDHTSTIRPDVCLSRPITADFIENDSVASKAGTAYFPDLSGSTLLLINGQIAAIGKIPVIVHI